MSEVIAISPGNPAFSLCFLQPSISYDVCSVHFSRSVMSERPHGLQHVRFPCPSTPGACSNSCPSKQFILCHSLLPLPSIVTSVGVFSSESVLPTRKPKYWSFSFISAFNEYSGLISFRIDWLDLLAVQGQNKIPRNKPIRGGKNNLYCENFKMLMQETEDDTDRWKYISCY